jgi:hypothetical protein
MRYHSTPPRDNLNYIPFLFPRSMQDVALKSSRICGSSQPDPPIYTQSRRERDSHYFPEELYASPTHLSLSSNTSLSLQHVQHHVIVLFQP